MDIKAWDEDLKFILIQIGNLCIAAEICEKLIRRLERRVVDDTPVAKKIWNELKKTGSCW